MARTTQSKEIDGYTYEVGMLPALEAVDLLADLGRMVGPALGIVVDAAGPTDLEALGDLELGAGAFERAVRALFQNADKASLRAVIRKLAGVTIVTSADGEGGGKLEPALDAHFAGRLASMAKWLAFALQVQFSDFSDALSTAVPKVAAKLKARAAQG